jgi:hypothetical protein
MGLKLDIKGTFVHRYASSRISNFVNAVRLGWDSYSFIFYIASIAAILVGLFGWAGWVSVIITILFFYFAGKFKEKVDADKKKIIEKEKASH